MGAERDCCRGVYRRLCKCGWQELKAHQLGQAQNLLEGVRILDQRSNSQASEHTDFVRIHFKKGCLTDEAQISPMLRDDEICSIENTRPNFCWLIRRSALKRFIPALYRSFERSTTLDALFSRLDGSRLQWLHPSKFYLLDALIEYAVHGTTQSVPWHLLRGGEPPSICFASLLQICTLPPPELCRGCRGRVWPCLINSVDQCLSCMQGSELRKDCCLSSKRICVKPCWKIQPIEKNRLILVKEQQPVNDAAAEAGATPTAEVVAPGPSEVNDISLVPLDELLLKILDELDAKDLQTLADLVNKTDLIAYKRSRKSRRRSQRETTEDETLQKTSMCMDFRRGVCTREYCKFAHSLNELRGTSDKFKTKMCAFWSVGHCKAGPTCRHAHGVHDLNERNNNARGIPSSPTSTEGGSPTI